MNWDSEKLIKFMHVFKISSKELCHDLGIPHKTMTNLIWGNAKFKAHVHLLDAYANARVQGKIKEHETMIEYYKNFK